MIVTDVDPRTDHRASRPGGRPEQEAPMSQPLPATHPAVVLRSHYTHLRALLAAAMIAILGLTAAVVMLATNDGRATAVTTAAPATAPDPSGARYDGGPDEGTRGTTAVRNSSSAPQSSSARYDGGPNEGSAALTQRAATPTSEPGVRYDGGPDEGTTGPSR